MAIMHLVVTNLCVWIQTIILETEEEYHHYYDSYDTLKAGGAIVLDDVCSQLTTIGNLRLTLVPYLFPCTVEYAVTSLTLFFIIWKNIGLKTKHIGYILKTNEMENKFNIDCQKSSRGLFFGIIVLLITIVTNIMYFVYKGNDSSSSKGNGSDIYELTNVYYKVSQEYKQQSTLISEVLELSLIIISGVLVIFTFFKTRNLSVIDHSAILFDEALVILSLFGTYIFSVFSALAILFSTGKKDTNAYLTLVISILAIIEGTLQTILILDGLKKRALEEDAKTKPGRELFTALVLVNVSLWISDTFSFKKFAVSYYQLQYYSVLAWSIISAISSPLAIFYRFHSSVCLSDCWKAIYME